MSSAPRTVSVAGAFDDLRSQDIRFFEESARFGPLTVLLWPDEAIQRATGKAPKFPQSERLYLLKAIRYVNDVKLAPTRVCDDELATVAEFKPAVWAVRGAQDARETKSFCELHGLEYRVVPEPALNDFSRHAAFETPRSGDRKKVIVTGCYDWFHSGHVRFFEEVSRYGDLYVAVGHDANVRLLKGEGRPLFPQDERRYVVGSIRFVTQALISTGNGWLDAEPEIQRLKPNIYAVNEDGDVPEKREYCAAHGIEYLVLKRTPAPGLPKRSSTDLRGF